MIIKPDFNPIRSKLDSYPTPPWATRALLNHYFDKHQVSYDEYQSIKNAMVNDDRFKASKIISRQLGGNIIEPACGAGHMAKTIINHLDGDISLIATDIYPYGYGDVMDFLGQTMEGLEDSCERYGKYDWVITNPPYGIAEEFLERSLVMAEHGVAFLLRSTWLEGIKRYNTIFKDNPPTDQLIFSERVNIAKEGFMTKGSGVTSYSWFIWNNFDRPDGNYTRKIVIPPCRKFLEREGDYDEPISSVVEETNHD